MEPTRINSYHEYCGPYVMEQYKDSTRLRALIDSVLAQCDDLEQAWFEILEALDLDDAVGPALDYIGSLVGVTRVRGWNDESYRRKIRDGSDYSGLPAMESLRRIILNLSRAGAVGLYPVWPAGLFYVLYNSSASRLGDLSKYLANGVDIAPGTFLCTEEDRVSIVNEENGMPFVINYYATEVPSVLYDIVTASGYTLAQGGTGNTLVALDF